jgi:hypothetical protein
MSLDVTLYREGLEKGSKDFNSFELRHLAINFAIYIAKGASESFDSWFNKLDGKWISIANIDNPNYYEGDYREELYSSNITHNLGRMATEAGIYKALWRPHRLIKGYNIAEKEYKLEWEYEESVTIHAKDIIKPIEKGLAELKARPKHFEQFNSENGWGMYEHFVPFVEKYLEALKEFPDSIVNICR